MGSDTIFKQKIEPSTTEPQETKWDYKKDVSQTPEIKEEVPFTDYEKMHNHPFVVDYYKLGDTWADKLGGFESEVNLIEGYFKDQIGKGKLKNDVEAVKDELKKIYRLNNIDKNERVTMQIEKLSIYLDFLKKYDAISWNHYRYSK